jgi:hypothetical protein
MTNALFIVYFSNTFWKFCCGKASMFLGCLIIWKGKKRQINIFMGILWISLKTWPNTIKVGKKTNYNVGNDLLGTLHMFYIIKEFIVGMVLWLWGKGQDTLYIIFHCDVGCLSQRIFLVTTKNKHLVTSNLQCL